MNKKNLSKTLFTISLILAFFIIIIPFVTHAATTAESCAAIVKDNFSPWDLINCYVRRIGTYVMVIASSLSTIAIIVSGFLFITSGGNSEKVKTARNAFIGAIIGFIIVIIAFAISTFVNKTVSTGTITESTSSINNQNQSSGPQPYSPANQLPSTNQGPQPYSPTQQTSAEAQAAQNKANQSSITISGSIDAHTCADLKNEFQQYYPSAQTFGEHDWTYYLKDIAIESTAGANIGDPGNAKTVTVFYKKTANDNTMYYDVWTRTIYSNGYSRTQKGLINSLGISIGSCNMKTSNENMVPVS